MTSYYTLELRVYLNKRTQEYENIITVSSFPAGPLSRIVRKIQTPKLSPFEINNGYNCNLGCVYSIISQTGCSDFMGEQEIPILFSFLESNGYNIQTNITTMMNTNGITNRVICYISYNKKNKN